MADLHNVVRLVDDFQDTDPRTRNSSPGSVNGNQLVMIGVQKERRLLKKAFWPIKNYIFVEYGTRNIWYKQSFNNAGVVKMGFSLSEMKMDKRSVPMEVYAQYFLDGTNPQWLERNDFELRSRP